MDTLNQELGKEKIISVRIPEYFYNALELQASAWGLSMSQTFRKILGFYFMPAALELELKESKAGELTELLKQIREGKGDQKFKLYKIFINNISEYIQFLKDTTKTAKYSIEYLERNAAIVENILSVFELSLNEFENKANDILKEF